jgi:hypothetical protein
LRARAISSLFKEQQAIHRHIPIDNVVEGTASVGRWKERFWLWQMFSWNAVTSDSSYAFSECLQRLWM